MSLPIRRRSVVQAASLLPLGLLGGAPRAEDEVRRLPIPPLLDATARDGAIELVA